MEYNRWWLCLIVLLSGVCWCSEDSIKEVGHKRVPRWLKFFSRGPEPEDEKYEGRELTEHLDNVLKGGTIGLEADMKKHVGNWGKLWEKVKNYFSGFQKFRKPKAEDREFEDYPPEGGIDPRRPPDKQLSNSDKMTNDDVIIMADP